MSAAGMPREVRALALYFRLNADAMNYTPRSHRGQRAARLMPLIRARYFERRKGG
jgi:hypothetical protein